MTTLNRRTLLKGGIAVSAAAAFPGVAPAATVFAPGSGPWRTFEIVTRLEIAAPDGQTQAWVPLPSVTESDWIRAGDSTWTTNAATATKARDPRSGADMLHVAWAAGEAAPVVEVTSRVATRDRAVELARPGDAPALSAAERAFHLAATELIPTDGIVKQTADKITAGATTDVDKARAIYEWIVENTYRDADVRGCGIGDITLMLKTGHLGGKCADINALLVGLARAAELPARDVYGVRVAPSRFGYKSLGAGSAIVTKAQHCRAEVWLSGSGWTPVDPADVRKVVLEEKPQPITLADPLVPPVRAKLFGAWEMNWLAYNEAQDITLPGSNGAKVNFFMYPQGETGGQRLDSLDPDNFKYTITAKELKV
jgi:transglutaminase-like putative cysteine protease